MAPSLLRVVEIAHRHTGNRLCFALIGHEIVEIGHRTDIDRLAGGRIEKTTNVILPRKLDRVVDGFERYLKLQDDTVGTLENVRGSVNVGWFQRVIGTFYDENPILSGGIDENRSNSTRQSGDLAHLRRIDAQLFEILDGRGTEQVVSDARNHEHLRSAEPCRHRLIGAFAAEPHIKLLSKNCFSRLGELVCKCSQVDVGTTHNCNARTLRHISLTQIANGEFSQGEIEVSTGLGGENTTGWNMNLSR